MEKRMKIGSLLIAFALVASLTLAVPASASSCCGNGHEKCKHNNPNSWDWIPDTYSIDSAAGSQIETILTTAISLCDTGQVHATSDLENKLHFVVIYGDNVNNISQITVPAEGFSCDPFYIKTITICGLVTKHLWGDLILKEDGYGQLALAANLLDNVDVHVEITGDDGTYTVVTTKENTGPAGSATVHLELNLKVYHSPDNTGNEAQFQLLVTIPLSVNLTTGKVSIHVTDTTPYPSGRTSLNSKSLSCEGTPHSPDDGAATLVGVAGALDVFAVVKGPLGIPISTWTDFISLTTLVIPPLV